ncbi:MAG TPA: sensor histidine kinase N-terminal domain-containing protein [Burkholderiaceae bacterium]|nr:sensor histidine kinase N-terminal domain-containing protein [Burkholderiaceae bacterium]
MPDEKSPQAHPVGDAGALQSVPDGEPRAKPMTAGVARSDRRRAPARTLTGTWATPEAHRDSAPPVAQPAGANPWRVQQERRSLFAEILDWMLAPLMLLWPMSVTITFLVAQSIANAPFDRHLAESLELLAAHVRESGGKVSLQLPLPARDLLREDSVGDSYYMVLGLRGEFVAGDSELPIPPDDEQPAPGATRFRFEQLHGSEIRLAYTWVTIRPTPGAAVPVLVQVAETLDRRSRLANEIVRGVIVPQFIVLPVAVLLVWFGLTRGLAPLAALQSTIRGRRPDDLSPIRPEAAPDELRPLVESFNELLRRMAQNLAAQKRFIADAAHQMKTPLAGLRTQAELAQRETDAHELRRSLRQIAASTERATRLINQLLALARAEHQATDVAGFEQVDLGALARDVVRDWVPQALRQGIDLGVEVGEAADPTADRKAPRAMVAGLPLLLRELINNLVDNALRFTPRGGTVTVHVKAGQRSVLLEVEDNGPGIPEAERGLVFERFYRVLGTKVDGSGLGLAIVREIAAQHEAIVRLAANPRCTDPAQPGTLVTVEFVHIGARPPTIEER